PLRWTALLQTPRSEYRGKPHGLSPFVSRSAIEWKRQRSGRADRAPGLGRAGEDVAWRQGDRSRKRFDANSPRRVGPKRAKPLQRTLIGGQIPSAFTNSDSWGGPGSDTGRPQSA